MLNLFLRILPECRIRLLHPSGSQSRDSNVALKQDFARKPSADVAILWCYLNHESLFKNISGMSNKIALPFGFAKSWLQCSVKVRLCEKAKMVNGDFSILNSKVLAYLEFHSKWQWMGKRKKIDLLIRVIVVWNSNLF